MKNCPSPCEFPEPRLRVTITISCRAAPEVGICTLGRCSQAMLLSERAEIKAHEVRGQFLSVWRGTFFSTAFQWDMGSQSAKAWGFLSSSCRNFSMQLTEKCMVTEHTCHGTGRLTHTSDGLKIVITFKWCLRLNASIERRLKARDSHRRLLDCTVLLTNSQSAVMIPPLQDASWCLQGWQIGKNKQN